MHLINESVGLPSAPIANPILKGRNRSTLALYFSLSDRNFPDELRNDDYIIRDIPIFSFERIASHLLVFLFELTLNQS